MKTDFSKLPREEIEARITTMLLGELPENEAVELMEFVSNDADLLKVYHELRRTISLVDEASELSERVTLSEDRREKLLASFKSLQPPELAEKLEARIDWRNWAAMAAMVGLLLGGATLALDIPGRFYKARTTAQSFGRSNDFEEQGREKMFLRGRGEPEFTGVLEDKNRQVSAAPPQRPAENKRELLESRIANANAGGRVEQVTEILKAPKSPVPSKIELPAIESDSPASAKNESWQFQAGQARGFGFGGGGAMAGFNNRFDQVNQKAGIADAEEPKQILSVGAVGYVDATQNQNANRPATSGDTAGKDTSLAYGGLFGVAPGGFDEAARSAVRRSVPNSVVPSDSGAATGVAPGAPAVTAADADGDVLRRGLVDKPAQMPPAKADTRFRAPAAGPQPEEPALLKAAPEQQVALGVEVDAAIAADKRAELADFSKKTALAVPPQSQSLVKEEQISRENLASVGKSIERVAEGTTLSGGVASGRLLTESELLGQKVESVDLDSKQGERAKRPDSSALLTSSASASETNRFIGSYQYFVQDVESLRKLRASIDQRVKQESAEASGPKAGPVQIVDEAQAGDTGKRSMLGDTPILGRLFKRNEERVARLEVGKDADISPLEANQRSTAYDPFYAQAESEKIKSMAVLSDVVDQLKLNDTWGEKEGKQLSRDEALLRLRKAVTVEDKGNGLVEIHARGENGSEAAKIANQVAKSFQKMRSTERPGVPGAGIDALNKQLAEVDAQIAQKEAEVAKAPAQKAIVDGGDRPAAKPKAPAATPQPEVSTAENAFSTFSLNVSDVSFKLAAASLEKGLMPEPATVRSEEFINAFDYRDPEPQGAPIGFVWERARYPFAQDRDLLRFSVKTAARGREAGKPLNLVLLLDSSGSMERADRVRILQECLKTLGAQLRPEDRISVVAFARTARLWVDGLPGNQASELPQRVGNLNPEGGTNLEEAMKVAYETARKHFSAGGVNRVVLLTDGAANLGDVEPESLKRKVEAERKKGIALDCFGIGWEGLNDELLETLSRNGDGRYGFVNTPEAAATEFSGQLAGALQVAASDVKVQVEWNPKRVTAYRQIGYAKHQLTKEQFRDNTVDAAEIGAAEAGNALYVVQVNAGGEGPLGTVRVRFKIPGTNDYREHAWPLNYDGAPKPLENAPYTLRLAGTASAFSELLVSSPYAGEVTTDRLLSILSGVPEHFAPDPRPKKLEWMIRQAKSVAGK